LAAAPRFEDVAQQIGFAAAPNAGDDLDLPIPHIGNDPIQIKIAFDFHDVPSVENLADLLCNFSMNNLRRFLILNVLPEYKPLPDHHAYIETPTICKSARLGFFCLLIRGCRRYPCP
jgi:hypothetical protein